MGFQVYVNDELVKEFEDTDHSRVDSVKLISAQGGAGAINVPIEMQRVDLVVNIRDTLESNYLDLDSYDAQKARSEEIEKASADRVAEGRRQMEEEAKAAEAETSEEEPAKATSKTSSKEPAVKL